MFSKNPWIPEYSLLRTGIWSDGMRHAVLLILTHGLKYKRPHVRGPCITIPGFHHLYKITSSPVLPEPELVPVREPELVPEQEPVPVAEAVSWQAAEAAEPVASSHIQRRLR
jgi:hypothetical protein